MKKPRSRKAQAGMLPEYDFSRGVRGKYAKRYAEGSNLILLDADVARIFPDSKSVNETLRALSSMMRRQPAPRRTK